MITRLLVGVKGQCSVRADLDCDVGGPDASSKTQESSDNGSETHGSDKKENDRRRKIGSGSEDWRIFRGRWVEPVDVKYEEREVR